MLRSFEDPQAPKRFKEDLDDLFEASRQFDKDVARSNLELRDAEDYLKTLTIYAWLAYRYPEVFTRVDDCEQVREAVNAFVERSLRSNVKKKCASCGADLPGSFAFKICESCHAEKRSGHRGSKEGANRRRGHAKPHRSRH
jgi:ATP-dependent RNA helicase SUPV3L1/SUV3